jgi:uncharacterized protein (TIGR00730 family)
VKRICVFAGARSGRLENYEQCAIELGAEIAKRGFELVYGGGKVGLMGALAQSALDAGATVIGVIPEFLMHEEILQPGLTQTIVVDDLFKRKALMIEFSDAYIALPGGIGTLDELLEIITWRQLNQLNCEIGLINESDYFKPWLAALEHSVSEGFVDRIHYESLRHASSPIELLNKMQLYVPTQVPSDAASKGH